MLDVTFEYLEMVPELLLIAIGVMVIWAAVLIVLSSKIGLKSVSVKYSVIEASMILCL